jgi:hypothetical protein
MQPEEIRRNDRPIRVRRMFFGVVTFALVAILCIVAGTVAIKRQRSYSQSDGGDDDFDFDAYEGFDKD